MSLIWLLVRSRVRFERLRRFSKGDNRDYAPISPIKFLCRFRFKVERLSRFAKGDSSDSAPVSSI